MLPLLLAAAVSLSVAMPAQAEAKPVRWRAASATAYDPCSAGTTMANGQRVHLGAVAMNILPLWTKIRVSRPVFGRRNFTVKDRIGWGTTIDFWTPSCSAALRFGRRTVRYRLRG